MEMLRFEFGMDTRGVGSTLFKIMMFGGRFYIYI